MNDGYNKFNSMGNNRHMNREEIIGNITTIGKFILITFGTPAMVAYANSNEFIILISAICGLTWAFLDSRYFNTFFKHKTIPQTPEILNDEYTTPDYEGGEDDGR